MNAHEWLYTRTRQGKERGPTPARALLNALGSPDARFDSLRVVGTNGKGSVCAMLEAGLLAAGIHTGRFTSPHLTHFEERIRINGQEISASQTAEFVAWAQQHAPDTAFFDLSLGLAAQVFAASGVRVAIMEAGVGGVSDATQALQNVRALLLTNVALDHTATLGPTTAQIARDKASAALPGVPLLTTATAEALEVVAQVAHDHGAPLYTPHTHPALFALPHAPTLPGPHQETNARLALAALRLLGYEQVNSGQASSEQVLDAALKAVWPARLERFVVQGRSVLLDGAHNPAAAAALALAVPHADVLLFGSLARKDSAATLAALKNVAAVRVFTHPAQSVAGEPHADLQALADVFGGLIREDARAAFQQALALTPAGGTLLVAGSLYLAGTLRPLLLAMQDGQPNATL